MISGNDSIDWSDILTLIRDIYWFIDDNLLCHSVKQIFFKWSGLIFNLDYKQRLPGKHIAENVALIVDEQQIFQNSNHY